MLRQRRRPVHIGLYLCLSVTLGCIPSTKSHDEAESPRNPQLEAAEKALDNIDLPLAVKLFREVAASNSSKEDRATAELRLANLSWRVYRDIGEARRRLDQADSLGVKRVEGHIERARMETEIGNFEAARAAASGAVNLAKSKEDIEKSQLALISVTLEEAGRLRLTTDIRQSQRRVSDLAPIADALRFLKPITESEPGFLVPSRLQLAAALLLDDGPAALAAWKSYYRVSDAGDTQGLLSRPALSLESILPTWKGANASRAARESLVLALADSRFFTEATLIALDPRQQRGTNSVAALPVVSDIIKYETYLRRIKHITENFYRDSAQGKGDRDRYVAALQSEGHSLWASLSWPEKPPAYTRESLAAELDERFGTHMLADYTGPFFGLSLGHRVIDEERTIEQYGVRATLRFVSLDSMVSNGFETWMSDGRSATGGWAEKDVIYQVRTSFAEAPLRAWREATEPELRKKLEDDILRESARDRLRALENPYAHMPGLALRLKRDAYDRLLSSLRSKGFVGVALRAEFISKFERLILESSFWAHEGRHSLDRRTHNFTNTDAEFRAKLSEIVFAPDPRIALFGTGILNSSVENTPHGRANQQIRQGLVAWIERHVAEVAKLNSSEPLLPQLDLLADEQIRDAFRSMDPLAK